MCFFIILLCTFKIDAQENVVIRGTVEEEGLNSIRLYKVVDGATVECGKYPVRENRTFWIEYMPEYEGFYAIGHAEKKNMFYLKKGTRSIYGYLKKPILPWKVKIVRRMKFCLNGLLMLIF